MNDLKEQAVERKRKILVVWAVVATITAFVFFNTTLLLFVRGKSTPPGDHNSPFASLPESSVPGRYRWLEEGEDKGIITLQADHSFIAANGATSPRYKWEMTRDAIVIIFQNDIAHFDSIESQGTYIGLNVKQQARRMEKIK